MVILITFETNLKMYIKATKYLMQVEIVRVFKQSVIHYIKISLNIFSEIIVICLRQLNRIYTLYTNFLLNTHLQ